MFRSIYIVNQKVGGANGNLILWSLLDPFIVRGAGIGGGAYLFSFPLLEKTTKGGTFVSHEKSNFRMNFSFQKCFQNLFREGFFAEKVGENNERIGVGGSFRESVIRVTRTGFSDSPEFHVIFSKCSVFKTKGITNIRLYFNPTIHMKRGFTAPTHPVREVGKRGGIHWILIN